MISANAVEGWVRGGRAAKKPNWEEEESRMEAAKVLTSRAGLEAAGVMGEDSGAWAVRGRMVVVMLWVGMNSWVMMEVASRMDHRRFQ